MKSKLRWILSIITLILGYLFQSASEQKLLFLDDILNDKVNKLIFDNPLLVLVLFGIVYLIIFAIIQIIEKDKNKIKFCNNVCKYIFKYIEKKLNSNFMQYVRVTIFKAENINSDRAKLVFYSRYQTRLPYKTTRLKFKPGHGCAGICFESQTLISKCIQEYDPNNPTIYIKESKAKLNFNIKDIEKLNMKSCIFLGVPIKCFDSGKTWGVLLIDSKKRHEEFNTIAREVEHIMKHYVTFF